MATLDDLKLPFLQLVVADYLRDTRHLSLSARGAWVDILCAMHVAQERGVVVFNRIKLARFLGTTVDQVDVILEELRDPNNATGRAVCEYEDLGSGNFRLTSRRMVRDEQKRQKCSAAGRKGGGNPRLRDLNTPPLKVPFEKRLKQESESESEIGDESPNPSSRPAAPQPSAVAGTNGNARTAAAAPGKPEHADPQPSGRDQRPRADHGPREDTEQSAPAKPRAKRERKLTDEQNAVRTAFIDWWCQEAYPRRMGGVVYEFDVEAPRNGAAVKKLLEGVRYDLERAKAIAAAYLAADDLNIARRNRPLYGITEQLSTWAHAAKGATSHNGARHANRPSAADRGEYVQPKRALPKLGVPAGAAGPVTRAG